MECQQDINKKRCNCSYEPCSRKYKCCDCIEYHLKREELPACYFSKEAERTYDRSIGNFISLQK